MNLPNVLKEPGFKRSVASLYRFGLEAQRIVSQWERPKNTELRWVVEFLQSAFAPGEVLRRGISADSPFRCCGSY